MRIRIQQNVLKFVHMKYCIGTLGCIAKMLLGFRLDTAQYMMDCLFNRMDQYSFLIIAWAPISLSGTGI